MDARHLHVLPYHHGNRSPRADPTLRGMVSGLTLSDSIDSLALLYLATIQAIAHGTRHIVGELNAHGYRIATLFACGGDTKNPVFVREHADVTGCRVVLAKESEAVLLGAAILGAVASGDAATVMDAMAVMSKAGPIVEPSRGAVAKYHAAKQRVFQRMYEDQMAYRGAMTGGIKPSGDDRARLADTSHRDAATRAGHSDVEGATRRRRVGVCRGRSVRNDDVVELEPLHLIDRRHVARHAAHEVAVEDEAMRRVASQRLRDAARRERCTANDRDTGALVDPLDRFRSDRATHWTNPATSSNGTTRASVASSRPRIWCARATTPADTGS